MLLLLLEIVRGERGGFSAAAGLGGSWGLGLGLVGRHGRGVVEEVGGVREVGEEGEKRGGVDSVDVVLGGEDDEDDDSTWRK